MNASAPRRTVMHKTTHAAIRELDRRINDRFDVRLLWDPQTGRVFVTVADERQDEAFALVVDPADALEAFHHPFAYASNEYDPRPQSVEQLLRGRPQEEEQR